MARQRWADEPVVSEDLLAGAEAAAPCAADGDAPVEVDHEGAQSPADVWSLLNKDNAVAAAD